MPVMLALEASIRRVMSSRLVQATRRLHSKAGQYRKTAWEVGSRQRTSRALLFTILVFLGPTSLFSSESVP